MVNSRDRREKGSGQGQREGGWGLVFSGHRVLDLLDKEV